MNSTRKNEGMAWPGSKRPLQIGLLVCAVGLGADVGAQTKAWSTTQTDNGKTTVKYHVTERTDENGSRVPLIEYVVTTTDNVSMQKCVALMKDVSRHKDLAIADASEKVKTVSDNEWIVYYYLSAPGPIPDSDIVARMTLAEDATEKTAVFTQTAAPSLYEKKGVKRFSLYNMTYRFKDLGNGQTEVTLNAAMSPAMNVPLWLIKASFPDSATKVVRNIVTLARK
ncbi:MAG: hypothetical protein AB2A00_10565 [Myxococcota bacterium]